MSTQNIESTERRVELLGRGDYEKQELRSATGFGIVVGAVSGGAGGILVSGAIKGNSLAADTDKPTATHTSASTEQTPPSNNLVPSEHVPGALYGATIGAIALVTVFRGIVSKDFRNSLS